MALVTVFNPGTGPVIYGDGKSIGGSEWLEVEQDEVQSLLDENLLLITKETASSIDDGKSDDSPVDSISVESVPDAPETVVTPATISKPRQRKPQPEKE